MSGDELNIVFCVTEDEAWFRAALEVMDGALEDAVGLVSMFQTAANHGQLAHAAGGVEALRTLREEFVRRRVEAFEVKQKE